MRLIFNILLLLSIASSATASPSLNFSDIISGPSTGIGDGLGSGAIVTVWGNNLGASQGLSTISVCGTAPAYIYYWKNADGTLPGGPADLYTYHRMQEIAFSLPASCSNGLTSISVTVSGQTSNTIPFTVRAGNIYHIKSTGNDSTGNGSFTSPWLTSGSVLSGDGKIAAGDIVYSHGIGASAQVAVGSSAGIVGTLSNPFAFIAYPNTNPTFTDAQYSIRNWSRSSYYPVFSKLRVTTIEQAFSNFKGSRIIGNKVDGPTINVGVSGWTGGGCDGESPDHCGGQHIYGNEVYNFGKTDGSVDQFHHLFYISNRSGSIAEGYKIGWNYLHDNPIYQGVHVYDQGACGGWSGSIDIHDNVVKNQGGNAINLNFDCTAGNNTTINVWNNLIITDDSYNLLNRSAPLASFRVEVEADTTVKILNNTFYGWGDQNALTSGQIEFRNNILFDKRFITYIGGIPTNQSDNIFFSEEGALSLPSWATVETGNINSDPMFIAASEGDFRLNNGSPAIAAGYDTTEVVPYDFLGNLRVSTEIGAFEWLGGQYTLRIPPGLAKQTTGTGRLQ